MYVRSWCFYACDGIWSLVSSRVGTYPIRLAVGYFGNFGGYIHFPHLASAAIYCVKRGAPAGRYWHMCNYHHVFIKTGHQESFQTLAWLLDLENGKTY